MKKIFCAMLLAVAFAFTSFVPVQANTLDVKTLTCAELEKQNEETVEDVLIWLAGGISASMDSTVFDYTAIGQFAEGLVAVCGKNKDAKLLDAIVESMKAAAKK